MDEKVDSILLDVDNIVFEQNTPICKTRIMHGSYGYYYIEMGNENGFKLDALTYEAARELVKALTADLVKRGETM